MNLFLSQILSRDLIMSQAWFFESLIQPNGYTEPLLQKRPNHKTIATIFCRSKDERVDAQKGQPTKDTRQRNASDILRNKVGESRRCTRSIDNDD